MRRSVVGAAAPELPSTTPPASWWIPNAPVTSIVPAGDRVYVSGAFDSWGPSTGHGVVVDAGGARIDAARFDGSVTAAAPDGAGGWYVGGEFETAGGLPRARLARVRADGALDPDWTPPSRRIADIPRGSSASSSPAVTPSSAVYMPSRSGFPTRGSSPTTRRPVRPSPASPRSHPPTA